MFSYVRELSCFHWTKSRNTSLLQAHSSVQFLPWVASLQNLEMGPLCSYDGFSLCAWYCLLTSSRLIILLVTSQSWGDHQVSSHPLYLNPLSPREGSDSLDLSPNSFNWKQFFLFFLEEYVAIWEVNISRSACTPDRCIHFYSLVSLVFGTLWDVFYVSLALFYC